MHDVSKANGRKRVLIICQLDRYSNGVKPAEVQRFLQERGHDVTLVDTYFLSKTPSASGLALLALGAAWSRFIRRWPLGQRRLSYYVLVADFHLRRRILSALPLDDFDLVICETSFDSGVLTLPTSARTLFDCPTPWADEMYFEGRLTNRQHGKLRRLETAVFQSVDYLAFWWPSYARYAVAHYGITGHNLITLDYGCIPAAQRAQFSDPPRIAYLGSLGQRFIDLPLLSRLTKLYPHIDVYGGPPPDTSLRLNYLGWSPPSVLRQYQFGLITCTQDALRQDGFSAKHLEYLAYGLPVLVPAWRRHLDLLRGSIPYDEHTFASVVQALSNEVEWQRMSDAAYAQAQQLAWDETLRPLESVLRA
jgi:hypothetical protein